MGMITLAAIVSEPQQYYDTLSEMFISNSMAVFDIDADYCGANDIYWHIDNGFHRKDLSIYKKKSSGTSFWHKFVSYDTVNVPIEIASENDFVPDAVMFENGDITLMSEYADGDAEYNQILLEHPGEYVIFMTVHF